MAAFTLAVKSPTSCLYLTFSFSSSVTLARIIAIDSFIFGTWSFRSRMFCSRIISGSSIELTKKPKKLRIALLNRFHIRPPMLRHPDLAHEQPEAIDDSFAMPYACGGPRLPWGYETLAASRRA